MFDAIKENTGYDLYGKNEKEIICVICPNSCRLGVWLDEFTDEVLLDGFDCKSR